jgi:2-amino-4-hydroxy-6-hydroxymethyldihydropteridine diphosphokinase
MTGPDTPPPREIAYIGLGSNLEGPESQLRRAMAALADLPQSRLLRCSSLYRSAPIGVDPQPDFVNAVCVVETALAADALLNGLLEIERRHGRKRNGAPGQPRNLDLDLLLYGEHCVAGADIVVPHPRLHERAFVLYPLLEIAPGLVVPGLGVIESLLPDCREQRIERLSG